MFTTVLKINKTFKKQMKSEVMAGIKTHPNGNTTDVQAGSLYIPSFT